MGYRWHTGSIAWVIHRVTGVVLTLYIFAHLYVLSNIRDPEKFSSLMNMMRVNPAVKLGELGLMAIVAYHALNGLRVTALEMGVAGRNQKHLFWASAAVCAAFVFYGAVVLLGGAH